MLRLAKLVLVGFALSLQRELAHRANLFFDVLLTATSLVAGWMTLDIVFRYVDALNGWRVDDMIVLLGAYFLVTGILSTFIEPNLEFFAGKVRNGRFDDVLLQPVPSLFTASLGTCHPVAFAQVVLGAAVIVAGLIRLAGDLTVWGCLAGAVLLIAGIAVMWCSRVLLASLAFWAPGTEPSVLYFAFWQLGRYPVSIYPRLVRGVLMSLVPVAFITTIPAQTMTHGPGLTSCLAGIGASLVMIGLTVVAWRAGLARYTGATS